MCGLYSSGMQKSLLEVPDDLLSQKKILDLPLAYEVADKSTKDINKVGRVSVVKVSS